MSAPLDLSRTRAEDGPDTWPGWGPGWQDTRVSRVVGPGVVGQGARAFARARAGLLGWDVQRLAGVSVPTSTPGVAPGVEVRQSVGPRGLLVARCRVSEVVDAPRRAGFAYEALQPHPEEGQEVFLLEHRDDDAVVMTVASRSRLVWAPARLASPLARAAQRLAVRRYLGAGRRLAR
ncbi:DUF1990 domain-containing protein [uncultured Pseudokineococcus sp.]|uniref:DUF1990 domain-containing protein n=1 Tax=uncultured Pseudokineococcus sp. TaxID=1642928 RepID=UPI002629B7ED|nr:DUF1990 domain-containing protein [uncultured Pseudokineococcus sp.]